MTTAGGGVAHGTPATTLREIERRVLWLAARMVDAANHDRPNADGVKVGGHQASSASMVSIMTTLWFEHLRGGDRVSVKPHASPVLHAINYLLGGLPRDYLVRLREFGGLQAYPSRTKDPDRVDFSTGSVGLGATAPLFAAATRRYVDAHFGPRPDSRFVALLGDAELDEGNIWEALLDPAAAGLGNVMWVVDLNRQSLDRVVPGMKVSALASAFGDAGWHVVTAKYGATLRSYFNRPGGDELREWIDAMPNHEYQALFGTSPGELRTLVEKQGTAVEGVVADVPDDQLIHVLGDLGGHDHESLLRSYRAADAVTDRPSVVFAYTVKGFGLPIAGDPLNHSALLTPAQIDELRARLAAPEDEWAAFAPESPAGLACAEVAERLHVAPVAPRPVAAVPADTGGAPRAGQRLSTQEAFGRTLTALARTPAGQRIVTVSPDVSVSTNLGGWINKVGVFTPHELPDPAAEGGTLRWHQSPAGRHIELGISEMNFFSYLAQLGLADQLSGELLLPIGTVYDPFVCRGLDAFVYGAYTGARFVVAGTPSGVSLAAEGGAHQSAITASIGLELPNVVLAEPAYATALDWLLCDALGAIAARDPDAESLYLRLSTRPLDQAPFAAALERCGARRLRADVLAGGYRLVDPPPGSAPRVQLVGAGAVLDGLVEAAAQLSAEGVDALVVDVTSLDLLYRGWAAARRRPLGDLRLPAGRAHVHALLERGTPIVTVHDAASHAMAWLGSVHGATVVPLGVDAFGQSGSVRDLHRHFELDADAIVNAALVALAP
ncbi:pyruvate dehydrogenase [uncultured Jatrophihabitans sp.]|uniref:transketolase-like TK C-terminal-containing protein n=1 Tax=uncultured Jatrophihabitans sp. TaxID=1610747 RepID=UPI0035CC1D3E